MCAFSSANISAVALPMPELAPVTSTALPVNPRSICSPGGVVHGRSRTVVADIVQEPGELMGFCFGESAGGGSVCFCPPGDDALDEGFAAFGQPQQGHPAVAGIGGAFHEPGPLHAGD